MALGAFGFPVGFVRSYGSIRYGTWPRVGRKSDGEPRRARPIRSIPAPSVRRFRSRPLDGCSCFARSPRSPISKAEEAAKALRKRAHGGGLPRDGLLQGPSKSSSRRSPSAGRTSAARRRGRVLKRDLGTVYVAGLNDRDPRDGGICGSARDRSGDPARPGPQDQRGRGGVEQRERRPPASSRFRPSRGRPGSARPGAPAPATPAATAQPAQGDFVHVPAGRTGRAHAGPDLRRIRRRAEPVTKVIAKYKGFGMSDFKSLELKKMGTKGWGAVTPCLDVAAGGLSLLPAGIQRSGERSGGDRRETRTHPFKVPVKARRSTPATSLCPGETAASRSAKRSRIAPRFFRLPPRPEKEEHRRYPRGQSRRRRVRGRQRVLERVVQEQGAALAKVGDTATEKQDSSKPDLGRRVGRVTDAVLLPSADSVCQHRRMLQNLLPLNDRRLLLHESERSRPNAPANLNYPTRAADSDSMARSKRNRSIRIELDKVSGGVAPAKPAHPRTTIEYAFTANILVEHSRRDRASTYTGVTTAINDAAHIPLGPVHLELREHHIHLRQRRARARTGFVPYVTVGGGCTRPGTPRCRVASRSSRTWRT